MHFVSTPFESRLRLVQVLCAHLSTYHNVSRRYPPLQRKCALLRQLGQAHENTPADQSSQRYVKDRRFVPHFQAPTCIQTRWSFEIADRVAFTSYILSKCVDQKFVVLELTGGNAVVHNAFVHLSYVDSTYYFVGR